VRERERERERTREETMNEREVKRVPFQDHGDGREGPSSNSSLTREAER